jgi:hypothetical protein
VRCDTRTYSAASRAVSQTDWVPGIMLHSAYTVPAVFGCVLRKRAACCSLTGTSRSECDSSIGVITLGWADIKTSSPLPRSVRFVEFARTDSASQFDRFLQPCPTTSRPRDIPAGNIRQRQTDLSPQSSLSKSLRGCGTGATDRPNQADNDSLICFIGRHFGRRFAKGPTTDPPPQLRLKNA